MIRRYADKRIEEIWSLLNKYSLWQETEIAYLYAWEEKGMVPLGFAAAMEAQLKSKSINLDSIDQFDELYKHDLNAALAEMRTRLDEMYHEWLHLRMTSYDTEEPPFAIMLRQSVEIVLEQLSGLVAVFKKKAIDYRYVAMMGRTHGMEGEPQSQGKRFLDWLRELLIAQRALKKTKELLNYSKGAGAMGNYGDMDPVVEEVALKRLGFKVCYGVGQIMPREIHAEIADALNRLSMVLAKIATDIRLGARSGADSVYQEPFGKEQLGSSAMPHKKNTIITEQISGLKRLVKGYASALDDNIDTWEERDIGQSSVERVAWPDIFHTVLREISNMKKVVSGLVVKTKNMLRSIVRMRGCYATNGATQFIKKHGKQFGITTADAYKIVQLASFDAFWEPDGEKIYSSFDEVAAILKELKHEVVENISIEDILAKAQLMAIPVLSVTPAEVARYNEALRQIFNLGVVIMEEWSKIFDIRIHLKNEAIVFEKMLAEI